MGVQDLCLAVGINKLVMVTLVHCVRYEIPCAISRPYTVGPHTRTKDVQKTVARTPPCSASGFVLDRQALGWHPLAWRLLRLPSRRLLPWLPGRG